MTPVPTRPTSARSLLGPEIVEENENPVQEENEIEPENNEENENASDMENGNPNENIEQVETEVTDKGI